MLNVRRIERTAALVLVIASCAGASEPLRLASDGKTHYSIVIGRGACEAEQFAAKELAYFLGEMTGADFPLRRDDAPTPDCEIVLGQTSRRRLEDVPTDLAFLTNIARPRPKGPTPLLLALATRLCASLGRRTNIPKLNNFGMFPLRWRRRLLAGVSHSRRRKTHTAAPGRTRELQT